MIGMIDQIRAACPQEPPGQFLATHYQFAALQEAGEANKRGAGRPAWSAEHALDQPPDLLPGRYLVRFVRQVDQKAQELHRTEIDLMVPRAAPPRAAATAPSLAAPPVAPSASAAAPPSSAHDQVLQGALAVAGLGETMQAGSHQELRAANADLQRQLAEERRHSGDLQARVLKLVDEKMQLVDLISARLPEVGRLLASAPVPPGEPAYVGIVREIWGGVTKITESLAPGINARLGAPPAAAALPAKDELARVQEAVRELSALELPEPAQAPLSALRRLVGLETPPAAGAAPPAAGEMPPPAPPALIQAMSAQAAA